MSSRVGAVEGSWGDAIWPVRECCGAAWRRACFAMTSIQSYEQSLSIEIARVLRECGAMIYGIDDDARVSERVPTFCFNSNPPASIFEEATPPIKKESCAV